MKKLMIGFVTLAAVVGATALPATADEWFNGGVAEGWPKAETLSGGAWTNTESSAFADGAVAFTNVTASALTFAATELRAPADGEVTINTTVSLPARETLPEPMAKAGVVSCGGFFYVIAKDSDGTTNVWTKTDIEATATATVKIVFTSATAATYTINGSTYDATIASVDSIQNVELSGAGTLSALSATAKAPELMVTVTPLAVTGASTSKVYTNDTVEVVGGGEPPAYTVVSNDAVKVVYTADAGYEFPGGATTWTTNFAASAATVTVTIPEDQKPTPVELSVKVGKIAQRYPWNGIVDVPYRVKNWPAGGAGRKVKFTVKVGETVVDGGTVVPEGSGTVTGTFVIDLKALGLPTARGEATVRAEVGD